MNHDINAPERKKDHIALAFESRVSTTSLDQRFYYEPILAPHPTYQNSEFVFLGKTFRQPFWVSSMTGGTQWAKTINQNLALMCQKYGFGMGLGSCRSLLYDKTHFEDFNVRKYIGEAQVLYANLGIAQLEQLLAQNQSQKIIDLVDMLQADGLIIHVNPLQEWLQPEGDRIEKAPAETISLILEKIDIPIIVKEVGQGMGKESLKTLLQMPLAAIDFAASGGTNFSLLELLRASPEQQQIYHNLSRVGHSAEEMIVFLEENLAELGEKVLCKQIIISGGIKDFLDIHYLHQKCPLPNVCGQASAFLKYAQISFEALDEYVSQQIRGLALAQSMLTVKK